MVFSDLWFLLALDGQGVVDHSCVVLLQLLSAQQNDEVIKRTSCCDNGDCRVSHNNLFIPRCHANTWQPVVTVLGNVDNA